MKNLHVLPTDHPSRLRYNIKTRIWELNEFHKYHTDIKSTHNIYVTSEEHIKEGDWYKVEVKKAGQFDFEKVNLNIVEQEQLNILVSKFLSADFETREKMLEL